MSGVGVSVCGGIGVSVCGGIEVTVDDTDDDDEEEVREDVIVVVGAGGLDANAPMPESVIEGDGWMCLAEMLRMRG